MIDGHGILGESKRYTDTESDRDGKSMDGRIRGGMLRHGYRSIETITAACRSPHFHPRHYISISECSSLSLNVLVPPHHLLSLSFCPGPGVSLSSLRAGYVLCLNLFPFLLIYLLFILSLAYTLYYSPFVSFSQTSTFSSSFQK